MKGIKSKMINQIFDKLTSKFTETIFCKRGSELEKQIDSLKQVLKKYPNSEKLKNELRICEFGLQGEKAIEFELKNANIGMYVLHDINIEYQDLRAQIDYIIITPAYTYFVECKKLVGNITVDSNGNFTREYYKEKQKIREGMYSPLSQAKRHIDIYTKIWMDQNNGFFDKLKGRDNLDIWNKPLVVMANSKNVLNLRYALKEYRQKIIKSDNLVEYLKKDMSECNKAMLLSKEKMYNIACSILINYNKARSVDYVSKYEQIAIQEAAISQKTYENSQSKDSKMSNSNINSSNTNSGNTNNSNTNSSNTNSSNTNNGNINNSNVRNCLLAFRKEKAKEKSIPAYYIFTNKELENILKWMPRTKEELTKLHILSDTKAKLHGDEIVKIVKENL